MRDPFPGFVGLALANGYESDLQAVGLGTDSRVYLFATQCSRTGVWQIRGFNELEFAQREYTNITMAAGSDGTLHLIGLSESQVFRVAWQDKKNGKWRPADSRPLSQSTLPILDVRLGLGANGKLQVLGVGDDYRLYLIAREDKGNDQGGTWDSPCQLLPQWGKDIFTVRMMAGGDRNLQVIGLEKDTLEAYLVSVQWQDGTWHKPGYPNQNGALRPGTGVVELGLGKGADGTLQVLGLCEPYSTCGGDVLLLAYQHGSDWKTDGQKGSLRAGKKFKGLTVGSAHDLNAIGLGVDDGQVYLVAIHSSKGWEAPEGPDAGILGGPSAGGYQRITAAYRSPKHLLIAAVGDGTDPGLPAVATKAILEGDKVIWQPGQSLSQRDQVGSWNIRLPDVKQAFQEVPGKGRRVVYWGHFGGDSIHHFQGMARYRPFYILTYDAFFTGSIILASAPDALILSPSFDAPNDDERNHPGGCQVIGDYLALSLESYSILSSSSKNGVVCFYWLGCMGRKHPPQLLPPRISRGDKGAGVAAITDIGCGDDRRYLVAVYDDGKVHFYLSNGFMLNDARCAFEENTKLTKPLKPGPDNMALLTGEDKFPYLIGLRGNKEGSENVAVLFRVDLNNNRVDQVDQRDMETTHSIYQDGWVGFRFGAGVSILDSNMLHIFCCGRNMNGIVPENKQGLVVNHFGQDLTGFQDLESDE